MNDEHQFKSTVTFAHEQLFRSGYSNTKHVNIDQIAEPPSSIYLTEKCARNASAIMNIDANGYSENIAPDGTDT